VTQIKNIDENGLEAESESEAERKVIDEYTHNAIKELIECLHSHVDKLEHTQFILNSSMAKACETNISTVDSNNKK
jgi:hypothetical protein